MDDKVPYKNTDTTGAPGRATAHGLERLDLNKAVLLLAVILIATVGVVFFTASTPRPPELQAEQYQVIVAELEVTFTGQAELIVIPAMDAWNVESYGDIDEWTGTIRYEAPDGTPVESAVKVDFNAKTAPLVMRKRAWVDPLP